MSSETNNRPIYVKKRTKKRSHPERLHGAFNGGFSSGYFNTVGSKNGWKPSDAEEIDAEEEEEEEQKGGFLGDNSASIKFFPSSSKKRKKYSVQKLEDFMDEEDANDWGGPMKVKEAYQRTSHDEKMTKKNQNANNVAISDSASLRKLLYHEKRNDSSTDSIGKQLLKVLGWREKSESHNDNSIGNGTKSYAYVTLDIDEKPQEETLLSSKRLKRVEMQLALQKNELIPAPKIDTYGMGYEPYKNAPEFKAHREMRKQRAEERARAAASSKGESRMNVYNMSALNDYDDDDDDKIVATINDRKDQKEGNVLAYETAEDFIGNVTVAGFALHDDDDQVYDKSTGHSASLFNKGERGKIDLSEYHNEVYESSDSEVEKTQFLHVDSDMNKNTRKVEAKLKEKQKSNIQSFAGALSSWISDGNANSEKGKLNIRAVTSDGEPPLTGFELGGGNRDTVKRYPGPDVPVTYEVKPHQFSHEDAISNMKELSSIMKQNMKSNHTNIGLGNQNIQPIAGKAFASLSTALKNRFITSTSTKDSKPKSETNLNPRNVKIIRSSISWQPSNLLLKRFNVNSSHLKAQGNNSQVKEKYVSMPKTREEEFFQNDVLGQIDPSKAVHKVDSSSLENHALSAEKIKVERPSLDLMRSIFESSSDEEEDGNSEKMLADTAQRSNENQLSNTSQQSSELTTKLSIVDDLNSISSDSSSSSRRRKKRQRSSSKSHHKKRKRRKEKRKDV